VDRRDRPFFHDAGEKNPVGGVELRRQARRWNVDETVRPLIVESDPQSRSVCRSMPPILAASVREAPSSTAAIASNRRACAASFARFASRPTSPAV
jgi:hypothetical protein